MRPNRVLAHLALCASSLLATACASGDWVELGGHRYQVEIADTDAERARGLMFRDELPSGHGMLFIHDELAPQAYWMKNTRIPLDILYFDDHRKLVSMQLDVPPCKTEPCATYPSDAPARYVLELAAGEARHAGARVGDVLAIDADLDAVH